MNATARLFQDGIEVTEVPALIFCGPGIHIVAETTGYLPDSWRPSYGQGPADDSYSRFRILDRAAQAERDDARRCVVDAFLLPSSQYAVRSRLSLIQQSGELLDMFSVY